MAKKFIQDLREKDVFEGAKFFEHENIKNQIVIISELESLIPPLSEEEISQLEQNIIKEGCREALQIWATTENIAYTNGNEAPIYVLVDGHNRYAICKKNSLDFQIRLVSFNSFDETKEFMIDNQLGRRNLSPEQMSYFRGLKYLSQKQEKGKYDREHHKGKIYPYNLDSTNTESEKGKKDTEDHKGKIYPYDLDSINTNSEKGKNDTKDHKGKIYPYGLSNTAALLAKEFNVSEKTIKNDAKFAASVDNLPKEIRDSVLQRNSTLTKVQVIEMGKLANSNKKNEEIKQNTPKPKKNKKVQQLNKIIELIRELDELEFEALMNEITRIKAQNN